MFLDGKKLAISDSRCLKDSYDPKTITILEKLNDCQNGVFEPMPEIYTTHAWNPKNFLAKTPVSG